jgi:hypothetical protein
MHYQENNNKYFFRNFLPNKTSEQSEQLNFAALEDVVFFLQGAASAAQATYQQDGHADRYDQRDEASAYKNPM